MATHVRAVRDLRNSYSEISQIIRDKGNVIITNNGKSESVLIPFEDFEMFEEYLHIRYVREKLSEAEAIADKPDECVTVEDLLKELGV